ncbi:MAG: exosortase C-terminal domain/associated protein EpsI [Terriglobales bacterium]
MPERSAPLARRSFALALVLIAAAAAMGLFLHSDAPPPARPLAAFPMQWAGWRAESLPLAPATLAALDLHDYLNRVYFGPDQQVIGLYIAYYPKQTFGDDIHSPKHCLPGAGWVPIENGALQVSLPSGAIAVNKYLVARGHERELVLYWFQQEGRVVRSEYGSKFYQVWDGLRRRRSDAALVRVVVPADGEGAQAAARGTAFIRQILPRLNAYVPD